MKMRASIVTIPPIAFRGTNTYYKAVLTILDSIFACVVIAPAIVGFWRSAWELMGIYVYPNDSMKSALVSTGIGFVGHAISNFGQHFFKTVFHPNRRRILFYTISRTYTFLYAIVCVNGWRGPWYLLDKYTDMELTTVVVTFVVAIVALVVMRALRNISGTPFFIANDTVDEYFDSVTMFRIPPEKTSLYILDTVFSVYIVGTLVVFVWRGAWILMDFYLFPNDFVQSSWASLILGYGGAVISYLLQPVMKWICDRLTGGPRLIVVDIFVLFCYIFTVNTWRGIWNLLNLYFLPGNLRLSCWITLSACVILLILLKCSNSLLVRGVYIDGEEPGGNCLIFPVYYLRLIFEHEKLKKIKKIQQDYASQLKIENDTSKLSTSAVIPNNVPLNLKNKDIKEEK